MLTDRQMQEFNQRGFLKAGVGTRHGDGDAGQGAAGLVRDDDFDDGVGDLRGHRDGAQRGGEEHADGNERAVAADS